MQISSCGSAFLPACFAAGMSVIQLWEGDAFFGRDIFDFFVMWVKLVKRGKKASDDGVGRLRVKPRRQFHAAD